MRFISAKTLGVLALVLTAAWAVAEAGDGRGHEGRMFSGHGDGPGPDFMMAAPMMMPLTGDPMHLVHMAEELDLSADQRKQVGAVMDASMPKMRDLMFRMADSRKALHAYLEGDQKDEGALRKIADEHGKVMAEMMFQSMKTHADMRAVLTDDQIEKLDELKGGHHRFGPRKFTKRLDD